MDVSSTLRSERFSSVTVTTTGSPFCQRLLGTVREQRRPWTSFPQTRADFSVAAVDFIWHPPSSVKGKHSMGQRNHCARVVIRYSLQDANGPPPQETSKYLF